jgi:hypothetical protein
MFSLSEAADINKLVQASTNVINQVVQFANQGVSIKSMAQKMLFCFSNISAESLLHILGYGFCNVCHNLVHFC